MLVAGVVLGVLLGPAVLGRLAPNVYDPMFVGSGNTAALEEAQDALEDFQTNPDTRQDLIEEVMAQYELLDPDDPSTTVAREEHLMRLTNRFADEEDALKQAVVTEAGQVMVRQKQHRDKLSGMTTILLLIVVALFAAEAILSPQRDELEAGRATLPPALARLVTVRYALMAGWLLIMLAQPHWLRGIDPVFGALLLAVVLIAGLIPLGKKHTQTTSDPFA